MSLSVGDKSFPGMGGKLERVRSLERVASWLVGSGGEMGKGQE